MPLIPEQTREAIGTLREQGKIAASGVRATLNHVASHAGALVELFGVEWREYAARQTRRMAALTVGFFLLLCGHLVFCAFACVLIGTYLGILWGMGIVCLVHFLAAGILISLAINRKPGPVAPATRQELTNDLQCLRILLKDEKGNC